MVKYLIKDTTREERERIVAESLGNIDASCDGCSSGIVEMYQDYIDGKKELREISNLTHVIFPGRKHQRFVLPVR